MGSKKIVGVIPARGGSVRLKNKNIRAICGKPLIAWTIEAAQKSSLLSDFFVSTEDNEIKDVSERFGASVLDRPDHLAANTSTTLEVLQHVVEQTRADVIVLLQCTCPIRGEGLIDKCIKEFLASDVDCLATGQNVNEGKWGSYNTNPDNYLNVNEMEGYFHDDGNVYLFSSELIKSNNLYSENSKKVITTKEEGNDINDAYDFFIVEKLLEKQLQ